LPAIAAGATSVGSGWDKRQRVCGYASYASRDPDAGGGGSWLERVERRGLIGLITKNQAEVLANRNASLAARLGPLPPPGAKEAFFHHLTVLVDLITSLRNEADLERRYRILADS